MHTDTSGVILLIVILLIVEIVAIVILIGDFVLYREVRDTPTEKIRNLNLGYKEIKGKAVALEKILESPLSNAPCIYYEFKFEKLLGSKPKHWETLIDDKGVSKLGIDDGTGIAEVDIMQAAFELKSKHLSFAHDFKPLDEIQNAALEKYELKPNWDLFGVKFRIHEKFIKEGDGLYVLGDVKSRENDAILMTKKENYLLVSDKLEEELLEDIRYRTKVAGVVAVFVPFILYWLFTTFF